MCFMAFYGNIKRHVFSSGRPLNLVTVSGLHFLFLLYFRGYEKKSSTIIDERNICFYSLTMDGHYWMGTISFLLITGDGGMEEWRNGVRTRTKWQRRFFSQKMNGKSDFPQILLRASYLIKRTKESRNTAGQTLLQFFRHMKKYFFKKTCTAG